MSSSQDEPAVDSLFDDDEELYHACKRCMIVDSRLDTAAIGFPNNSISTNRSKYSEPQDVLDHPSRDGFGVVAWNVADIPTQAFVPKNRKAATYQLNVKHVPTEDNYAHSEIQIWKNGVFDRGTKIKAKSLMQEIRQLLSESSRVVTEPSV